MNASSYYLGVSRIRVAQSLDYCVEFCTSLFVVSRLYLIIDTLNIEGSLNTNNL
jgi:hypothetical protein